MFNRFLQRAWRKLSLTPRTDSIISYREVSEKTSVSCATAGTAKNFTPPEKGNPGSIE
jgi:hypothetical protein